MPSQYKACFLGYESLSEIARQVIRQRNFPDLEILLLECTPDTLETQVNLALEHGCSIFIAGSSNAAEFRRISTLPLIEIQIQPLDYAIALKKAHAIGQRPMLFTYQHVRVPDLQIIRNLLDFEFDHIIYEDTYDLTILLSHADAEVVVGASQVASLAQNCGKESVLLYPGISTVEDAIRRCRSMLINMRYAVLEQEIYHAIVQNSPTGIICINDKDKVILYNPAAEALTHVPHEQIHRRHSQALFPWAQLQSMLTDHNGKRTQKLMFGDRPVEVSSHKIEANGRVVGALALLAPQRIIVKSTQPPPAVYPPQQTRYHFDSIQSSSENMRVVVAQAKLYSKLEDPCVIIGEPGAGKSMFAHCMHAYYHAQDAPFYRVNCSIIPDRQAMQYLMGREDDRGTVLHRGLFELSREGTLVLEQLWNAPAAVLHSLALVLRDRQYLRLGGIQPILGIPRILTLVNAQEWSRLRQCIPEELYFLLTRLTLRLPPLRERAQDIPLLFEDMLQDMMLMPSKPYHLPKKLYTILGSYSWPGNAQELSNIARRFSIFLDQNANARPITQHNALVDAIGRDELLADIFAQYGPLADVFKNPTRLRSLIELLKAVFFFKNDDIARIFDISRTTLWRLCQQNNKPYPPDRDTGSAQPDP